MKRNQGGKARGGVFGEVENRNETLESGVGKNSKNDACLSNVGDFSS